MDITTAIVIDDLAADRRLTTRALHHAGWEVLSASNSVEGMLHIERVLRSSSAPHTVIITDLHMPNDPGHRSLPGSTPAGATLALQVRVKMSRGDLVRAPIVALTALSEREIFTTALAFGCDAVLAKPATPDLATRVVEALAAAAAGHEIVGADALLRLLRSRLVDMMARRRASAPAIGEREMTRALLAFRRQGIVGLGQSDLARALWPDIDSAILRGERTHELFVEQLATIQNLGALEAVEILHGELVDNAAPEHLAQELGISLSEYYRRREEAISVLLDLLTI